MKLCLCPNCDALWSDVVSVDQRRGRVSWPGGEVRLRPGHMKIMSALLRRPREFDEMCDVLWGDDPDGGPDDCRRAMRVSMATLRRRLTSCGFPGQIITVDRTGYDLVLAQRVSGTRLKRVAA